MPNFNVMIVGNANAKSLPQILKSKYLNMLYTNFKCNDIPNIEFNTFRELAEKCKSLHIDFVIVEDEKYILQGIADVLKANFVNCIALNSFWTELVLSNEFAKKMLTKYEINVPSIVIFPDKFPVVFRANRLLQFAYSLDDVIRLRQKVFEFSPAISKSVVLEKYLEGKEYTITSLFDGKHLVSLTEDGLDAKYLNEYNNKLQKMFVNENSEFIGFINSRIIISEEKLYNLEFDLNFPLVSQDLIFLINLAIYQKLNELC